MGFQAAPVRFDQGYGVVGEHVFDGPKRAEPGLTNSADPTMNVFGRAFSLDGANPGKWRAGDPAGNGERVAIMTGPKQHASYGTQAGGPLAPTITIANNITAEFSTMGQILVQCRDAANVVGNIVRYVKATGEIVTAVPGAAADPLLGEIPNAVVVRVPQPAALGLAVIQLTTQ